MQKLKILQRYIKYYYQAETKYQVHSPFVFNFVTKGLYKKSTFTDKINKYPELNSLTKKEKIILSKIITYFKINKV